MNPRSRLYQRRALPLSYDGIPAALRTPERRLPPTVKRGPTESILVRVPDELGLIIPGLIYAQRALDNVYIFYRHKEHIVIVRAIDGEVFDFADILAARDAVSMRVSTAAIENDDAFSKPSCFHLNATTHPAYFNDEIVALIFSEGKGPPDDRSERTPRVPRPRKCLRSFSYLVPSALTKRTKRDCQLGGTMERAAGIEPALSAWKAEALPLCNARKLKLVGRAGFEPA